MRGSTALTALWQVVIYACTTSGCLCFFPGVFLSSRVTGSCRVTTDLIMRVNVRTTTMAVENRLAALCFARSPRATHASRATNLRPSGLVALHFSPELPKLRFVTLNSAESRQSYSRRSRCWQNGIETARCCRRAIHAAGERS